MTRVSSLSDLPKPPAGKSGWPWTEAPEPRPDRMPTGAPWPRISVVTPSFNQASYIEETIRSVLLQGYPNLEYIIMDGGSRDSSVEIIRQYAPWLTYWTSQPDHGQADAINQGFEHATGEYLAWINSDDYLYPGFIHQQATALQSEPELGLVYGDVDQILEDGRPISPRRGRQVSFDEMLSAMKFPIPQQSALWRRSIWDQTRGLDARWRVVLDRDFFLRAGLICKIKYLPGNVAVFRHHPQSKSISETRCWLEELPALYTAFFQRDDLPPMIIHLKRSTLAQVYLQCARIAWRNRQRWRSGIFLLRSVGEKPQTVFANTRLARLFGGPKI